MRSLTVFLLATVFIAIVPFSLSASLQQGGFKAHLLLVWLILGYSGARLALLAVAGRPDFLAITFFVFVYIWGGLAPLVEIMSNRFPWGRIPPPDDQWRALIIMTLSLVFYEVGRISLRLRVESVRWIAGWYISQRSFRWAYILMVAGALYGFYYFGGPERLVVSRATFDTYASGDRMGKLLATTFMRVPSFIVLLFYLVLWRRFVGGLPRRDRWYGVAMGGLAIVLFIITNYPPSLPRFWLGPVGLTLAFCLIRWKEWHSSVWVVGLLSLVIWVYPYADMFRYAETFDQAWESVQNQPVASNLTVDSDFDVFLCTANFVRYTDLKGFTYGKNILGAALFWVPRRVWPDKPINSGILVAATNGYLFTNQSGPLWGELYIAFGYFSLVLVMFGYGLLSGLGDRVLRARARANLHDDGLSMMIKFAAAFQFFLLRGDLMNAVAYSLPAIALFALCLRRQRLQEDGSLVDARAAR